MDDPLDRLASSIDGLVVKLDDALARLTENQDEIKETRTELRRWQRWLVILAVLLIAVVMSTSTAFSLARQADCDRTNDARRILNEGDGPDLPLRDCRWPA